jgi:hypothetical protein
VKWAIWKIPGGAYLREILLYFVIIVSRKFQVTVNEEAVNEEAEWEMFTCLFRVKIYVQLFFRIKCKAEETSELDQNEHDDYK